MSGSSTGADASPVVDDGSEAVDPDVDTHVRSRRTELHRHRFVLPVIALGGMLGASARYGAALVWPTASHAMPWTTFTVNVVGCVLIGVLMVFVVEVGGAHPLLRPFAGVGVLGGFTTFSTYSVDTTALLQAHRPLLALGYWAGTLVAALVAVTAGVVATRLGTRVVVRLRRRRLRDRAARGRGTRRPTGTESSHER
jgi:CrcB protein